MSADFFSDVLQIRNGIRKVLAREKGVRLKTVSDGVQVEMLFQDIQGVGLKDEVESRLMALQIFSKRLRIFFGALDALVNLLNLPR